VVTGISIALLLGALPLSGATLKRAVPKEDLTGNMTTLHMAKTHDESCDVLDSKGRAEFRRALSAWIDSLAVDDAQKGRIRNALAESGPDRAHNCSGAEIQEAVLWRFRDPRGEDPRGQFGLMIRAKNYELKCQVLSQTALREFYNAGLAWIAKTGAAELQKGSMSEAWKQNAPPADTKCDDLGAMIDFIVTWSFRDGR
jgi:hypothetical protein